MISRLVTSGDAMPSTLLASQRPSATASMSLIARLGANVRGIDDPARRDDSARRDGGGERSLEQRLAELALEDLAAGVAGQLLVHEPDLHRDLERGEASADVVLHVGLRERRAVAHADDGTDLLAETIVRDADDRGLGDVGVLVERGFDLGRVDVLATADDDVLDAVDDEQVAVLVDAADVARVEPAVGERLGRRLVETEVAAHDGRSLQ